MGPLMGEIKRQRRLRISSPPRANPCGGPAQRAGSIGADRELNSYRAAGMVDGNAAGLVSHRQRRCDNSLQTDDGGAGFERRDQVAILYVVAEGIEPDLRRRERNFGRAEEPARIVHQADFLKRRGLGSASLPNTERFQRRNRAGEEGGSTVVGHSLWRDQQGLHAGRGERKRGDQARRSAPDDCYLGRECTVHLASCRFLPAAAIRKARSLEPAPKH